MSRTNLHFDQVDVRSHRLDERQQISNIRGQNFITVFCEECDGSIDDVQCLALLEQHANLATEFVIESDHLNPGKQSREVCLAKGTAAPNLPDYSAVGQWGALREAFAFKQRHDVRIESLKCNERASIEHEHSARSFCSAPPDCAARGRFSSHHNGTGMKTATSSSNLVVSDDSVLGLVSGQEGIQCLHALIVRGLAMKRWTDW